LALTRFFHYFVYSYTGIRLTVQNTVQHKVVQHKVCGGLFRSRADQCAGGESLSLALKRSTLKLKLSTRMYALITLSFPRYVMAIPSSAYCTVTSIVTVCSTFKFRPRDKSPKSSVLEQPFRSLQISGVGSHCIIDDVASHTVQRSLRENHRNSPAIARSSGTSSSFMYPLLSIGACKTRTATTLHRYSINLGL